MEVQLSPEEEAFVREALKTGRIHRAEQAVHEALRLWEKQERNRIEIIAALDEADADLEAGRYSDYTEGTSPQLASELKREARAAREHGSS
jgi:putative addiction module CopG family antidote